MTGRYASPAGTPFGTRGIERERESLGATRYEVVGPIEVRAGYVAPAWGGPGEAIQFEFARPIEIYLGVGSALREIAR